MQMKSHINVLLVKRLLLRYLGNLKENKKNYTGKKPYKLPTINVILVKRRSLREVS